MCALSFFNDDPIRGLVAFDSCYKINFDTVIGVGWLPYNFGDGAVARVPAYEDVNIEGGLIQADVRVSYWDEYVTEGMRPSFAELLVHRLKAKDFDLYGISSIAD